MKPDTELPFEKDSLYGIRHPGRESASRWHVKEIKASLLADMIGDADLSMNRDQNLTPWLEEWVYQRPPAWVIIYFFARDKPGDGRPYSFMRRRTLRRPD